MSRAQTRRWLLGSAEFNGMNSKNLDATRLMVELTECWNDAATLRVLEWGFGRPFC
jgi:hypothetical protein